MEDRAQQKRFKDSPEKSDISLTACNRLAASCVRQGIKRTDMATLAKQRISSHTQRLAGKYLTFAIQGESYGIDVLQIREIIQLSNITSVPRMPAYVRGVINLRGKIIPVIDLRVRFGFGDVPYTPHTCIVVVQARLPDGKSTHMGAIVDDVEEVTNIPDTEIEETPDFGGRIQTSYILGMAKVKGSVKTLIDLTNLLGADAVAEIKSAAA